MYHGPEGIPIFQYFFSLISTYPLFLILLPPTPIAPFPLYSFGHILFLSQALLSFKC